MKIKSKYTGRETEYILNNNINDYTEYELIDIVQRCQSKTQINRFYHILLLDNAAIFKDNVFLMQQIMKRIHIFNFQYLPGWKNILLHSNLTIEQKHNLQREIIPRCFKFTWYSWDFHKVKNMFDENIVIEMCNKIVREYINKKENNVLSIFLTTLKKNDINLNFKEIYQEREEDIFNLCCKSKNIDNNLLSHFQCFFDEVKNKKIWDIAIENNYHVLKNIDEIVCRYQIDFSYFIDHFIQKHTDSEMILPEDFKEQLTAFEVYKKFKNH